MNILAIGDVVGNDSCEFLKRILPGYKRFKAIDFTIVNGENSADGNGITPKSAEALFEAGADVITSGNHVWRRREIYEVLEENKYILRPANYPDRNFGRGFTVIDFARYKICVINLQGTVYMESLDSPFEILDKIILQLKEEKINIIIVDFHAEATSEKKALACYADGRISALYGTHTHVQTADETVLPGGTGYITDLGMTGAVNSILGVKKENIIDKFLTKIPGRFETEKGDIEMGGAIFNIDEKTGKTLSIERIAVK